jgi:hypothetical protein
MQLFYAQHVTQVRAIARGAVRPFREADYALRGQEISLPKNGAEIGGVALHYIVYLIRLNSLIMRIEI